MKSDLHCSRNILSRHLGIDALLPKQIGDTRLPKSENRGHHLEPPPSVSDGLKYYVEFMSEFPMSLQQAALLVPFRVLVDAPFSTLGFLDDRLPGMLTFIEHRHLVARLLAHYGVSAALVAPSLIHDIPEGIGVAISENPRRSFFELQNALALRTKFYGSDFPSQVDPSAQIHARATVMEKNVRIGPEALVDANACIGPGCTLERNAVVLAGAVLGGVGFQTYRMEDEYLEMAHAGTLLVGAGARIFSNATIARGLFRQATRIGPGTRVGNNAFISHNVDVGELSFVGHGAIVNGNVRIGRKTWIGPGAVLANGVCVGDGAKVSLGSVVIRDIAEGEHVSGNFAVDHKKLLRNLARIG